MELPTTETCRGVEKVIEVSSDSFQTQGTIYTVRTFEGNEYTICRSEFHRLQKEMLKTQGRVGV